MEYEILAKAAKLKMFTVPCLHIVIRHCNDLIYFTIVGLKLLFLNLYEAGITKS